MDHGDAWEEHEGLHINKPCVKWHGEQLLEDGVNESETCTFFRRFLEFFFIERFLNFGDEFFLHLVFFDFQGFILDDGLDPGRVLFNGFVAREIDVIFAIVSSSETDIIDQRNEQEDNTGNEINQSGDERLMITFGDDQAQNEVANSDQQSSDASACEIESQVLISVKNRAKSNGGGLEHRGK